jgi:hypothetical protein
MHKIVPSSKMADTSEHLPARIATTSTAAMDVCERLNDDQANDEDIVLLCIACLRSNLRIQDKYKRDMSSELCISLAKFLQKMRAQLSPVFKVCVATSPECLKSATPMSRPNSSRAFAVVSWDLAVHLCLIASYDSILDVEAAPRTSQAIFFTLKGICHFPLMLPHQENTSRIRICLSSAVSSDSSQNMEGGGIGASCSGSDPAQIHRNLTRFAPFSDSLHLVHILYQFFTLASGSHLGSAFSYYRRILIATSRYLAHHDHSFRGKTLDDYRSLLDHTPSLHTVYQSSLDVAVAAVAHATEGDEQAHFQLTTIVIMRDSLAKKGLRRSHRRKFMQALHTLATGPASEVVSTKTAEAFLQSANVYGDCPSTVSNIVDFIISPYISVRKQAIGIVHDISFWNRKAATAMLEDTPIIGIFCLQMRHGSSDDCAGILQVCKELVTDPVNCRILVASSDFLACIIDLVTTQPIINRTAHINAVDVILILLSTNGCLRYCVEYASLLPWLIAFANRTSNTEVKRKVVKSIVSFSNAVLG